MNVSAEPDFQQVLNLQLLLTGAFPLQLKVQCPGNQVIKIPLHPCAQGTCGASSGSCLCINLLGLWAEPQVSRAAHRNRLSSHHCKPDKWQHEHSSAAGVSHHKHIIKQINAENYGGAQMPLQLRYSVLWWHHLHLQCSVWQMKDLFSWGGSELEL